MFTTNLNRNHGINSKDPDGIQEIIRYDPGAPESVRRQLTPSVDQRREAQSIRMLSLTQAQW